MTWQTVLLEINLRSLTRPLSVTASLQSCLCNKANAPAGLRPPPFRDSQFKVKRTFRSLIIQPFTFTRKVGEA